MKKKLTQINYKVSIMFIVLVEISFIQKIYSDYQNGDTLIF